MAYLQIEHCFLKTLTYRFFLHQGNKLYLQEKIPYCSPTVVKEAVNKRMAATTVISKTRESLSKTNALSSDRSKAGVRKSLFIAASPSRPINAKNFKAKKLSIGGPDYFPITPAKQQEKKDSNNRQQGHIANGDFTKLTGCKSR